MEEIDMLTQNRNGTALELALVESVAFSPVYQCIKCWNTLTSHISNIITNFTLGIRNHLY